MTNRRFYSRFIKHKHKRWCSAFERTRIAALAFIGSQMRHYHHIRARYIDCHRTEQINHINFWRWLISLSYILSLKSPWVYQVAIRSQARARQTAKVTRFRWCRWNLNPKIERSAKYPLTAQCAGCKIRWTNFVATRCQRWRTRFRPANMWFALSRVSGKLITTQWITIGKKDKYENRFWTQRFSFLFRVNDLIDKIECVIWHICWLILFLNSMRHETRSTEHNYGQHESHAHNINHKNEHEILTAKRNGRICVCRWHRMTGILLLSFQLVDDTK